MWMLLAVVVVVLLGWFWARRGQDGEAPTPPDQQDLAPGPELLSARGPRPRPAQTFRAGFSPLFIFIFGISIPLAVLMLVITHEPSLAEFLWMCAFASILGLPLAAIGTLGIRLVFSVSLDHF